MLIEKPEMEKKYHELIALRQYMKISEVRGYFT